MSDERSSPRYRGDDCGFADHASIGVPRLPGCGQPPAPARAAARRTQCRPRNVRHPRARSRRGARHRTDSREPCWTRIPPRPLQRARRRRQLLRRHRRYRTRPGDLRPRAHRSPSPRKGGRAELARRRGARGASPRRCVRDRGRGQRALARFSPRNGPSSAGRGRRGAGAQSRQSRGRPSPRPHP